MTTSFCVALFDKGALRLLGTWDCPHKAVDYVLEHFPGAQFAVLDLERISL